MYFNFFLILSMPMCFSFTQELTELKQVQPRSFPHIVNIHSHEWCHGILITTNYVLTNARCVTGSKTILIYLGWYSYPEYNKPVNESDIQIYRSSKVTIYPDYQVTLKYWSYQNDIGLVKLTHPVSLTSGVKPAKLADSKTLKKTDLAGEYGTVFGWWPAKYLSAATVQIRSHEDCQNIFGLDYLRERQLCVKWPLGDRLCSHHSLPLEVNRKLVGLQLDDPLNNIRCEEFQYKFTNVMFYYDWIMKNSDLEEYLETKVKIEDDGISVEQISSNLSTGGYWDSITSGAKDTSEPGGYVKVKKQCKVQVSCPTDKEG